MADVDGNVGKLSPKAAEALGSAGAALGTAGGKAGEVAGEAAAKAAAKATEGLAGLRKGLKDGLGAAAGLEKKLEQKMHVKDLMKFADLAVFGSTAEADEFEFQKQEQLKKKWGGLLHPDTNISSVYDMIQMGLLVYLLFTLPYNLAFDLMSEAGSFAFYLEVIIDCALGFDMFLNFFRFQIDPRTTEVVTNVGAIRKKYVKGWFWLDALALFPFDHALRIYFAATGCGDDCASARNEARSARMIRLGKLSRFARLSKLAKLSHLRSMGDVLMRFLKNLGVTKLGLEFIMRVSGLCFLLVSCTHLLGCLFLHMGQGGIEEAANETNGRNWMLSEYGSLESAMDAGMSYERYVDAVYWVSTVISSVGYGDITPQSTEERFFAIFCITFGAFLNAYIVGVFTIMISNLDQDKANFDAKMRSMTEMFRFLNVPPELDERVGDYFAQKFASRTLFNAGMLDELPTRLRAEMTLHRFERVIDKVPFFHGCRQDAIVDICTMLRSHSIMPGDDIISRGEPYRELIIISTGKARTIPSSSTDPGDISPRSPRSTSVDLAVKDIDAVIEYVEGSFFGELEFLGISIARSMTVRATRYCEVSTLNPLDIEDVLDVHIGLKRRLQRYGVLKQDMEKMMESDTVDEIAVERMKQQIEDTFEDTEEMELRAVFEDKDANGNKLCEPAEFINVLQQLGVDLSETQANAAFTDCDTTGRGEVTFNEFLMWWGENENKMRAAHHDETLWDAARDAQTRIGQVEVAVQDLQRDMTEALKLVGA